MKTLTKSVSIIAAITLGLFFTSCKKQGSESSDTSVDDSLTVISQVTESTPPTPTETYSHVQFVNANPVIGPLSLYIAGNENGVGLNLYGEERGYYNTTASATREPVVIKSATGKTLRSTSAGFYVGQYYTMFYVGETNNQDVLLFNDNRPSALPAAGTAQFRFLNAAPSSPALDVLINNNVVISGQGYKGYTFYKTVSAGTYSIQFNIHGTNTTVATIPSAVFESGRVYSVYARDNMQNNKVVLAGDMYTVE